MRMVLCLLVAPLAACTDNSDNICEAFTMGYYVRTTDVAPSELVGARLALGGKQRFAAFSQHCDGDTTVDMPEDLRLASTADPTIASVDAYSNMAVVTGVAAGTTQLDAKGAIYMGYASITVAAIDHITLAPVATGTPFATIELRDHADTPIIDDTVTVTGTLSLGDRWDHLAIGSAAPGTYDETIHAGGSDWPVTVTVTP